MVSLEHAVQEIIAAGPQRVVLSAPRAGSGYRRATVTPLAGGWQVERLTATQAFHRNIPAGELAATLVALLQGEFTQLMALAGGREYGLRITKKGKVLTNVRGQSARPEQGEGDARVQGADSGRGAAVPGVDDARMQGTHDGHSKHLAKSGSASAAALKHGGQPSTATGLPVAGAPGGRQSGSADAATLKYGGPQGAAVGSSAMGAHGEWLADDSGTPLQHDRVKRLPFPEGVAIPPLVDIGIFTAEGKVVAAKRDKYRQVNRFVQLVSEVLKKSPPPRLHIVEFGCGKSALSFALYHYLTHTVGLELEMTGLDLRPDVVAASNAAAQRYGYGDLRFMVGDIADYHSAAPVDMVIALHACDTATDLALAKAVQWGARWIFSVPCCQHELNAQMQGGDLAILTRYGLVQERVAALMTDAIRANLLAACGYKTRLLEFVGFEHTPKNIMIRAEKSAAPAAVRQKALGEVRALCGQFGLQPCLLGLLQENGALPGGG